MPLPVCQVQCYVYSPIDGLPEVGATITAKLNRYEVYQGHIVVAETSAVTDVNGLAVLPLWPNELGSTESAYKVKIQPVGKNSLTVYAVVPLAASANLFEIATLPVYEGKPDGQLGVELANVAIAAANAAAGSAATSATTASQQAVISTTKAEEASTSAGSASTSAGTATTQAGIATTQAGIATTQAVISTDKAVEAAASAALSSGSRTGRNMVVNGAFAINQQSVSGSVVLAAGAYGHDQWRAGAAGCTYTFSAGVLTISAGSLQQPIDGQSLISGAHVLSWVGTAQGKIGAGAYGASGAVSATMTAGTNAVIEFGTGTLSLVQFERGATPTAFESISLEADLKRCKDFWKTVPVTLNLASAPFGTTVGYLPAVVYGRMRAVPSVVIVNGAGTEYYNGSGTWVTSALAISNTGEERVFLQIPVDSGNVVRLVRHPTLSVSLVLNARLP